MTTQQEEVIAISRTVPLAKRHIQALDGIRGLAILGVMLFHFLPAKADNHHGMAAIAIRFALVGWCDVDLFFVLSGFLITGILLDTRDGPGYFRNFYARRTLRIFPLYYGVLLIAFGVGSFVHYFGRADLAALVPAQGWLWTYSTNWGQILTGRSMGMFDHFWSLAIEEQFYLVWPLVVLICSRRLFPWVCGALIASAIVLRSISYFGTHDIYQLFLLNRQSTPGRADTLVAGALLAFLIRSNVDKRLLYHAAWIALGAGAAVAFAFAAQGKMGMGDPVGNTWAGESLIVAFTGLIALVVLPTSRTRLVGLMESRWLRTLGKYSYGMYVYHVILLHFVPAAIQPAHLNAVLGRDWLVGLVFIGLLTGTTFAVSVLSWHLYEKHFLKLKKYFEYRTAAEAP